MRQRSCCPLLPALMLGLLAGCGGAGDGSQAPQAPLEVFVTEVVTEDVPVVGEWVGETRGKADIEIRARVTALGGGWVPDERLRIPESRIVRDEE